VPVHFFGGGRLDGETQAIPLEDDGALPREWRYATPAKADHVDVYRLNSARSTDDPDEPPGTPMWLDARYSWVGEATS
jgi:hypothetical protein